MAWEIVFMLVILKIPIVYLCVVVWWAIKAEPAPPDLAEVAVVADTPPVGGAPTAAGRAAEADAPARAPPGRLTDRTCTGEGYTRDARSRPARAVPSATDTVAGFLAVGSIILSALALGAGLILELDARPGAHVHRRRHPRARRGPAQRPSSDRSRFTAVDRSRWSRGWSA